MVGETGILASLQKGIIMCLEGKITCIPQFQVNINRNPCLEGAEKKYI